MYKRTCYKCKKEFSTDFCFSFFCIECTYKKTEKKIGEYNQYNKKEKQFYGNNKRKYC